MNNTLVCIIGSSGSGKTTIVESLEMKYGLKSIQSYTTRPPRYENESGHIFVNQEAFDMLRNDLVAYTMFNFFEYGATKQQVDSHDLYVVDYRGYEELLEKYKGNKKIISIFINASDSERIKRMLYRGDSTDKVMERIEHDRIAFKDVKENCDYVISNDILEETVEKIYKIIKDGE